MPNNIKAQWVEAHQDTKYSNRDLSPEAILNCKVDTDAYAYMSTTLEPSSTPPIFLSTAVTLTVAGVVVTNKTKEVFRSAASCTDLPFYICKKTGWTIKMMAMVQWDALGHAFDTLTLYNKIQVLKFQHNRIPTATRLEKLYLGESCICPVCAQKVETWEH
eukprot:15324117-Ditylum_brightwellii.AAC.1